MFLKKNNILINNFNSISKNKEIFELLFSGQEFSVERIISNGQKSPENFWYDQKNNEWVIVLQGNAKIEFQNINNTNEIIELNKGDYILIPAHQQHRVLETSQTEETIWLAIHYKSI